MLICTSLNTVFVVQRSTKRYLPLERDLRSSSSPPSSRAGSAVVGFEDACPVPLEDHSLYQIRDKIGFGESACLEKQFF